MIVPMLARPTGVLPPGRDYLYEIKLDGQRTIAEVSKDRLLLYTRSLQNVSAKYPELKNLFRCLKAHSAVLDGEIVALEKGIPSFELLQQRINLREPRSSPDVLRKIPVLYYVFDILELNGKSLLRMPLSERKEILSKTVRISKSIKILPFFDSRDVIVKKAQEFGYEGVIAKRRASYYLPGQRKDLWLKFKFQQSDSFVVGGWLEGRRAHDFGSLLVGKYRGKEFVYCGRVGTGFNEPEILKLMEDFWILAATRCPFSTCPKIPRITHWLKPRLVVEVKFKQWTNAGMLRSPVYLGLRPDLRPNDCRA